MRIVTWVAAAAALLIGAPVAFAHEGSPNFLSQINEVTPAAAGVDVQVLNRDDRLLLTNNGDATVLDGLRYVRADDGTAAWAFDDREVQQLHTFPDGQTRLVVLYLMSYRDFRDAGLPTVKG